MIDDQQNRNDDVLTPGAEVNDRIVRRGALAPKLPKDFKIERQGSALRLRITDQNRTTARSGTVSYLCGWADGVDTTTKAGLDAGAARIEMLPLLAAPGVDDQDVTLYLADTRYQTGVFYCFAVDRDGGRSTDYLWSQSLTSEITDSTVPSDVTHPQVSGSGEYVGADVVEAVSVACRAPLPIGSFDGVQLYLKDYINLGTTQEGEFHRHNGQPGGSLQFKVNYQVAKRVGTGTITVTNGSAAVTGSGFLTQAQAGDKVEVAGARATIQSVNSDTSITLTGNWAGKTVAAFASYAFYAKVRVFLVSVSKGGTRRTDVTLSPFVDLVFDGSLGTPNAPATMYTSGIASPGVGNAIRIEWDNVLGTALKGFNIYRSTGSGADTGMLAAPPVPAAGTTQIDFVPYDKALAAVAAARYQTEDSNFSAYDKENGQAFVYYVTTVNERGDESGANYSVANCRLDSPADTDPSVPGRSGYKNMLYNAMFAGAQNVDVADTDAGQDANLFTFVDGGYTPGIGGRPYGGNGGQLDGTGRYKGFTRWAGTKTLTAAGKPQFTNGDECKFPAPGAGGQACYLFEEIEAWDTAKAAQFIKARKNGFIVFQIKLRRGATVPTGTFALVVEQYSNNTLTGNAKRRYRDSSSVLQWFTGTAANYGVAGSVLTTSWALFYAIYQFDASLGTTKQMRLTLQHQDSTVGDVYAKDPMVNDGQELGLWTADMGDPYISFPIPGNPADGFKDGDGHRAVRIPLVP